MAEKLKILAVVLLGLVFFLPKSDISEKVSQEFFSDPDEYPKPSSVNDCLNRLEEIVSVLDETTDYVQHDGVFRMFVDAAIVICGLENSRDEEKMHRLKAEIEEEFHIDVRSSDHIKSAKARLLGKIREARSANL